MRAEQRAGLVVCADDYGLTPGVSRAIRELLAARRISATSVMTVSPFWPAEAEALRGVSADADVGLHLTLTDQAPLGVMPTMAPAGRLPPISRLLRASITSGLPPAEIEAEIERQVAAFIDVWKRPPAHVDGHHHVHQLPGIRTALLNVLARQPPPRPYLRSCYESPARILVRGVARRKALIISSFGVAFTRTAKARGFSTNEGFSGVYSLASTRQDLPGLFARFVRHLGRRPLVMCHPGHSDPTLAALDSMTVQRDAEYAFLAGDEWPAILDAEGVQVSPFRST